MKRLTDKERKAARKDAKEQIEHCRACGDTEACSDTYCSIYFTLTLATALLDDGWTAVDKGLPKKPCHVNMVLERLDGAESPFALDCHFNGHSFIGRGTGYSKANNFRSENYRLTYYMIIPAPPEPDDERTESTCITCDDVETELYCEARDEALCEDCYPIPSCERCERQDCGFKNG